MRAFSELPTVPITVAPKCFDHCTSSSPTPLAAACTMTISPGLRAVTMWLTMLEAVSPLSITRSGLLVRDGSREVSPAARPEHCAPRRRRRYWRKNWSRRRNSRRGHRPSMSLTPGAERHHHAGRLVAEDDRHRQRLLLVEAATPHVDVGEVERDRRCGARRASPGPGGGNSMSSRRMTSGPPWE